MKEEIKNFLRLDNRFPHILCPGCGIGTIANILIRSFNELNWDKNNICLVSGIGCSSRIVGYIDCDTFHTLHGRAIPCAVGVKLAKPHLKVVVIGGDGDILAIGLSHFVHAARRNIDLTVIIINNYNYGMTGGQVSPTTPSGKFTYTTPYGNPEEEFNIYELAKSSGAVFFARATTYHVVDLKNILKKAFLKKGFSVVEVISQCPTLYGRLNRLGDAPEMLVDFKNRAINISRIKNLDEIPGDKIVIGILLDREREEYGEKYQRLREQIK
jgi:2-oxoglutarate ferredoxin oxidoreductase subunit beta